MTGFGARYEVSGKVAIVTGASSGLGVAFATALAAAGASVVVVARRADRLASTVEAIEAAGGTAFAVPFDVRDAECCGHVVEQTVAHFGRLDVLVNNAGVNHLTAALKQTEADFRRVIDTNLVGPFLMAQASARVMTAGSSVINISSCSAYIRNAPPHAAYVASKLGLVGLTYNLASEWARDPGIRVNAIVPGYFPTELLVGRDPAPRAASIAARVPLQRDGDLFECANAVVFLASDASSYLTGTVLEVDGGLLARQHAGAL